MSNKATGDVLVVTDLDGGNSAILEHAEQLFAAGAEGDSVSFLVQYVEGDQDRGGALSSPDLVKVTRDGQISA